MRNPLKALWLGLASLTGTAADNCLELQKAASWAFHGVTVAKKWQPLGPTPNSWWSQAMLRGSDQPLTASAFIGAQWREDYSGVGYVQCCYLLVNENNGQQQSVSFQYRSIMNDNSLSSWRAHGKIRVCQADSVSKCPFDLYAQPPSIPPKPSPSMAPKRSPTLHHGNEHREIFGHLMPEEIAGLLRLSLISGKVAKALTLNYNMAFETRVQANDCFTLWGKAHANHLIIDHKMLKTQVMGSERARKCHQFMRNLHNHVKPTAADCTLGEFGEVTCLAL